MCRKIREISWAAPCVQSRVASSQGLGLSVCWCTQAAACNMSSPLDRLWATLLAMQCLAASSRRYAAHISPHTSPANTQQTQPRRESRTHVLLMLYNKQCYWDTEKCHKRSIAAQMFSAVCVCVCLLVYKGLKATVSTRVEIFEFGGTVRSRWDLLAVVC